MGTCAMCGNEVKEEPYREPAPMPKVEAPKAPQVKEKTPINIVHRIAMGVLFVGGIAWSVSSLFDLRTGVHLGLGILAVAVAIPIADLVFVRFPIAVGRLSRGDRRAHDGFFETDWDEGGFLILMVPLSLAVVGAVIYFAVLLLTSLGHFINALL